MAVESPVLFQGKHWVTGIKEGVWLCNHLTSHTWLLHHLKYHS